MGIAHLVVVVGGFKSYLGNAHLNGPFSKKGFLKCIQSFCNILCWNIGESGLETCCNKDSNDLFDQLFLLLWIREWYFPTCFQPNRRLRAKNSRAGAEKHGRRKIWKKCKGSEIKRGSTWGQCGCHQRRKSAITVMVTDSVQWTRHTSSAIGKMTPAPVWNPWSFHLRELDAFIKTKLCCHHSHKLTLLLSICQKVFALVMMSIFKLVS